MSGLIAERVLQAIHIVTAQYEQASDAFRIAPDYDVDDVSKKVVRIIISYVDYINRTVWYRSI